MARLPKPFYERPVIEVAQGLLGKLLVTRFDGITTSGIITETEAYHESERACHAYQGRRTKRTEVLFDTGGISYVYLCYGIHCLFNVTTGKRGEAAAVLIRAIQPKQGLEQMCKRRSLNAVHPRISSGPGMLTKALGITLQNNARSLVSDKSLWIENGVEPANVEIAVSPRIGIDYAGADAELPWRFYLKHNKWVSKSRKQVGS